MMDSENVRRLVNDFIDDLTCISVSNTSFGNTQSNSNCQLVKLSEVLNNFGFIEVERNRAKMVYNNTLSCDNGYYYIRQPNGSQKCPDVLLFKVVDHYVQYIQLELKLGKNKICWNDGFPRSDILYLYTDTIKQRSVLFSSDVMSAECRELYDKCRLTNKLNNERIKSLASGLVYKPYFRLAGSQTIDIDTIPKCDSRAFERLLDFSKHARG